MQHDCSWYCARTARVRSHQALRFPTVLIRITESGAEPGEVTTS